jgi:hypothetical protein
MVASSAPSHHFRTAPLRWDLTSHVIETRVPWESKVSWMIVLMLAREKKQRQKMEA